MAAVYLLEAMLQHWPVVFFQDPHADVDLVVRADPENVRVVGGVVDLAQ